MALAMVAASLALGAMALAGLLPYGETFVARSNRLHEAAQRAFDRLIAVARPRWGFAVSGVALVFAVLAAFGLNRLLLAPEIRLHAMILLAGGVGVFVLAGAAAIRDWRAILSCLLVLVLSGAVGLWGLALARQIVDATLALAFLCAFGAGSIVLFAACAEAGRYGRSGDDATIAAARTLVRMGPGLFFAALTAAMGFAVWTFVTGPAALALAGMVGFAGAGALVFQPALAVVIESWFPRPATIASRYRLG